MQNTSNILCTGKPRDATDLEEAQAPTMVSHFGGLPLFIGFREIVRQNVALGPVMKNNI